VQTYLLKEFQDIFSIKFYKIKVNEKNKSEKLLYKFAINYHRKEVGAF